MFLISTRAAKVAQDLAMSEISLIFVLPLKTNKTLNDMAKVQINLRNSLFLEDFFSIMELFYAL